MNNDMISSLIFMFCFAIAGAAVMKIGLTEMQKVWGVISINMFITTFCLFRILKQ